jgi:hypothetical protein
MIVAGASEQTIAQGQPKPSELSSANNTTIASDAALALSTECNTRTAKVVSSGAVPATSLACAFANYLCAASGSVTAVHTHPLHIGVGLPQSSLAAPNALHREDLPSAVLDTPVSTPARASRTAPSHAKPAELCPCCTQRRLSWPAAQTPRPVRQYLPHGLPRLPTRASQRA